MIVAVFAKSKADAPTLEYRNDDYYDRHFREVQKPNNLLYLRPGKTGAAGRLGIQNVVVIVVSDNMDRVNELFGGMNLEPLARLFH